MNDPSPQKTTHVMLIDDQESVLFALKLLLQAIGYSVSDFSIAEKAIRYLENVKNEGTPDIIICDLRMPGMNGIGVLEAVRMKRPDIPFVLMSAHATNDEVKKANSLGAAGFLAKPFTPTDFNKLVSGLE